MIEKMYQKLIETVSEIVRRYGIGILTDSKFWSVLTDLYPFGYETKLKDKFKSCISNGWIATLVSMAGNKSKTLDFIRATVNANEDNDRKETAACLFSVAISIGSCTVDEYKEFFIESRYNPNPKPSTTPKSKYNKKKSRSFWVWWSGIILVCLVIILMLSLRNDKGETNEVSIELNEYQKKLKKNEELVEKRKNFNSALSFKDIELGSDYKTTIVNAKSNPDFYEGEERYYKLATKENRHAVFQLMNNRLDNLLSNKVTKSSDDGIISGKVYSVKSILDTIPIKIYIFELKGKVPFLIIEYTDANLHPLYYVDLMRLYLRKYGGIERQSFDGLPFNPDKAYFPQYSIEAMNEDFVWTFPKGAIRLGLKRIIYATTDFLNSANQQFELLKKEYKELEKIREDSIRMQEELKKEKQLEDSIKRVISHNNALKEI